MSSPASQLPETALVDSISSTFKLQQVLDVAVNQVAGAISGAATPAQTQSLRMLFETQARLTISQHRLMTAARLTDVIAAASRPETVRRACMALLRINLNDFSNSAGRGGGEMLPPRRSDHAVQGLADDMLRHFMNDPNRMDRFVSSSSAACSRPQAADRPAHHCHHHHGYCPRSRLFGAGLQNPTQFARARYTLAAENPRSDAMRKGFVQPRAFSGRPIGARANRSLAFRSPVRGRDPPSFRSFSARSH